MIENVAFLGDRAREMAAEESDRSKVLDTKAAGVVAASVALTGAGAAFAAWLAELEGGSGAKLLWTIELGIALVLLVTAGGLAAWVAGAQVCTERCVYRRARALVDA